MIDRYVLLAFAFGWTVPQLAPSLTVRVWLWAMTRAALRGVCRFTGHVAPPARLWAQCTRCFQFRGPEGWTYAAPAPSSALEVIDVDSATAGLTALELAAAARSKLALLEGEQLPPALEIRRGKALAYIGAAIEQLTPTTFTANTPGGFGP